jgi:UDP-N-acetylmuramoyl-tripeptide--D-alanyl-D-alanine ligase
MIGLPMTVLGLGKDHDTAVVEAGINKPGEMAHLARAAAPDVAVITGVGPVHLEGLGTVATVALEKFDLVLGLKPGGTAVLPADDRFLTELMKGRQDRALTFGGPGADFRAEDVRMDANVSFTLISDQGSARVSLNVPGRHNIRNALAAAAACAAAGVSPEETIAGLEAFTAPPMRMETVFLSDGRILIKDCYNANPLSVNAALDTLDDVGKGKPKLALLADMKELGPDSPSLHLAAGAYAARIDRLTVCFVGEFGEAFREGFLEGGGRETAIRVHAHKDEAWRTLVRELPRFDVILVKGSRSTRMEEMADRIIRER